MASLTATAVTPTILLWLTGCAMPFWKAGRPEHFAVINQIVFNGTLCIGLLQSMGVIAVTNSNAVTIYAHLILSAFTAIIFIPLVYLFSPNRRFHFGVFSQVFIATTVGNVLVVGVPIVKATMPDYISYLYILLIPQNAMLPLYIGLFEYFKFNREKPEDAKGDSLQILKKAVVASLKSPLTIATICAIIWMFISTYAKDSVALRSQWPPIVYEYFSYLNQVTVPMGTISIGFFTHNEIRKMIMEWKDKTLRPKTQQILPDWLLVLIVLLYKNFVCPPFTGWICSWFKVDKGVIDANMIAQTSPCALFSFVFSSAYGWKPRLAAYWVIINNFLLFGSVPYVVYLTKHLFLDY